MTEHKPCPTGQTKELTIEQKLKRAKDMRGRDFIYENVMLLSSLRHDLGNLSRLFHDAETLEQEFKWTAMKDESWRAYKEDVHVIKMMVKNLHKEVEKYVNIHKL